METEHDIPEYLEKEYFCKFPGYEEQLEQADYIIVTPKQKADIIIAQLKDLELYDPNDHTSNNVMIFEQKINEVESRAVFSIKIPQTMLNHAVESLGLKCCITNLSTSASVKVPFKENQKD